MQIKPKQQLKAGTPNWDQAGVRLGCRLCNQPPHKFLFTFKDLLIDGTDLTQNLNLIEGEEYRNKEFFSPADLDGRLNRLYEKFFKWKCQIKNFLEINQSDESDRLAFWQSGNTPTSIRDISYEKNKDKFLKLTEAIKNDIDITLKNLKELENKESNSGKTTSKIIAKDENHEVTTDNSKLLTKDQNGNYFYKGMGIDMNRNTIYFDVFDTLFHNCDVDGCLSYEKIEKEFIKRGWDKSENDQERNKRIRNAVSKSQGFFKFARVNGHPIKSKTPDGKQLIDKDRGVGLRLNNPVVVR